MEQIENQEPEEKSKGKSSKIFFFLSVVSFIASLIFLWQGLVEIKGLSTQFVTVRKLVYSLLTFQNSGIELLAISLFLLLISLQFSIYSLITREK